MIKDISINQRKIDLGEFEIHPSTKSIWQIGYPSHTTDVFKYSDQLRNYVWQELVPNNLTYRIDKNDDWYYLQNDSGKWNIEFSSNNLSNKNLLLKVALAGATQKQMDQGNGVLININLNGKKIFSERFENDRAAYRSALKSGRYHLIIVLITYNQL